MVNVAYDASVEQTPGAQIEEAEKRLFDLAEKGQFGTGFQSFETAVTSAIDLASAAYKRDGHLSGLATGLDDLDRLMGGLQGSDLIIVAGRPGMGKSALATNVGFNIAKAWRGELQPDGSMKTVDGGIVGLFSLEMSAEQLATRIIAEQSGVSSANIRRGRIDEADFARIVEASREMQRIPFYIDQTGGPFDRAARRPRPPAQAPARPRPVDRRLCAASRRHLAALIGKPRAGNHRDHHQSEGAGQGTGSADPGPVAALAPG